MAYLTYPLNFVDYDASDAETWLCTRGSGVFYGEDFGYSLTGNDTNITITEGLAWIHNHRWAGKVFKSDSPVTIDLGVSDATLDRIDVVAIQFSSVDNATKIVIKKGTPASSPVMPSISQTETVYELYLFSVYRSAGSFVVASANVTDLRLSEYCGLMADGVTRIDTAAIESQISELIAELKNKINNVEDGSAYMMGSVYDPNGRKEDIFAKIDSVATAAANAQTAANAAVPRSGGTFTGNVTAAASADESAAKIHNIIVVAAGTDPASLSVPAGTIVMVKK